MKNHQMLIDNAPFKVRALTEQEILEKIVEIISKYLPNSKIILFGSRAKGNNRPNSDFDVAVETEEPVPVRIKFNIQDELEALPTLKKFDILYLNEVDEDFKEIVLGTGRVLYERGRISVEKV